MSHLSCLLATTCVSGPSTCGWRVHGSPFGPGEAWVVLAKHVAWLPYASCIWWSWTFIANHSVWHLSSTLLRNIHQCLLQFITYRLASFWTDTDIIVTDDSNLVSRNRIWGILGFRWWRKCFGWKLYGVPLAMWPGTFSPRQWIQQISNHYGSIYSLCLRPWCQHYLAVCCTAYLQISGWLTDFHSDDWHWFWFLAWFFKCRPPLLCPKPASSIVPKIACSPWRYGVH